MRDGSGKPRIVPVILCGGAGTRLWPLSRDGYPKQFLPLVDGRSTFAMTLDRVADSRLFSTPLIVTGSEHRHLAIEALRVAGVDAEILLEPARRDSAAAVASAAAFVARRDERSILLILAADHVVRDVEGFRKSVEQAMPAAEAGHIVTFGIRPTNPATGFGYIRKGAALPECPGVCAVAVFAEKPDAATAARYIAEGYLWNSGNFMVQAAAAMAEMRRQAPAIAAGAEAAVAGVTLAGSFVNLPAAQYGAIPAGSFDYALMEKTDRAAVVEAAFDWRDIGTWESLGEANVRDDGGNSASGRVMLSDSRDCSVHSASGLVALLGVENLVVASHGDAVLVASRDRLGAIKDFVGAIARERRSDGTGARDVRPWGFFEVIGGGGGYQVKRLVVDPDARLSLQKHRHRAEHWVVVDGVADVTVGDGFQQLTANQSAFIPQGTIHRLGNSGKRPVTVVEVQLGDYLGEDDIERLADDYGRASR